ncbi:MAG: helix-turn-helix transcriptional regulator [Flavobacteriales bacterium]
MEQIQQELNDIKELILNQSIYQKDILSLKETAQFLQFSESCLYKLTSAREIPHYKVNGRKILFKRVELLAWIDEGKVVTSDTDIISEQEDYLNRNFKNQLL